MKGMKDKRQAKLSSVAFPCTDELVLGSEVVKKFVTE